LFTLISVLQMSTDIIIYIGNLEVTTIGNGIGIKVYWL
jgi:hypothetical protein